MSDFDEQEPDKCIADSCWNDALYCSVDCAMEDRKKETEYSVRNALWQMLQHNELQPETFKDVTSNDDPALIKAAANFIRRWETFP